MDIVRLLIKRGAHINEKRADGETPLLAACSSDSEAALETVSALIALGADTTQADPIGETPLIRASRKLLPEITRRLLDKGASVAERDSAGNTPLLAAFDTLQTDKNWLHWNPLGDFHGIGIDSTNGYETGDTPRSIKHRERVLGVVSSLLQKKSDVNAQNADGETPLIKLAKLKSKKGEVLDRVWDKFLDVVFSHRPDGAIADGAGNTAFDHLDLAAKRDRRLFRYCAFARKDIDEAVWLGTTLPDGNSYLKPVFRRTGHSGESIPLSRFLMSAPPSASLTKLRIFRRDPHGVERNAEEINYERFIGN